MGKEYDLMYELGRGNWIDAIAGEAVMLGFTLRDAELEVRGAELADLVKKIRYDDDEFYKVEVYARSLEMELSRIKDEIKKTIFIDKIRKEEKPRWPTRDWEYELLFVEGKYQIWMNLLDYNDQILLTNPEKTLAEEGIRQFFSDPSFKNYRYLYEETENQGQKFRVMVWRDFDGKILRKIVNHDHADGGINKGWLEKYFFDDFGRYPAFG
ncbi:MAG: hypothetical protein UW44_C0008G0126 [Candidatus Collierbacteria bacterium GW2011_GWB2_44_22]|uniref:Uncharacterized protein n=1 Tax=Candidatus Collierbacteria bacterium GW2011_GWB2_44_22 TaxID=1618387 RepID=A0A0G1KV75_9BACT|nr:MAG: hypothetical protein UW44_C0008G0126 [Candidatus Collierbacteria bacterium GW2011_GWB2_44_22]